jgi:hypothetical protein
MRKLPINRIGFLFDVVVVWNQAGFKTISPTLEDTTGFKSSTFDVGQKTMEGLGLIDANLEPCLY